MSLSHDRLALTGCAVVDGTGAPPASDQTVLVDDGVITMVGPAALVRPPDGIRVVDLTGRFVIPGLVDMHVHSDSATDERHVPAVLLAAGITRVREMWGRAALYERRERVASGSALGPRSTVGSQLVDGEPALWSDLPVDGPILSATTPAQARRVVAEIADSDADFVKVYSRLQREPYLAVLDEAGHRGLEVVGHRSDAVPLLEQIRAGQRSFEHLYGLWPALAREADRHERAPAAMRLDGAGFRYAQWFREVTDVEWEAVRDLDGGAEVVAAMVEHDVAVTPTLAMHRVVDLPGTIRLDGDGLHYLTPDTPAVWELVRDEVFAGGGRTAAQSARHRHLYELRLALVGALHDAGVRLLAGTDAPAPGLVPGVSLHEELALLVDAGLTPSEALLAATREPARFLGIDHRVGAVLPGYDADLVVLDADPTLDIRHTRRVRAVVGRGRLLDRAELDRMLAEAQRVAAAYAEAEDAR